MQSSIVKQNVLFTMSKTVGINAALPECLSRNAPTAWSQCPNH